MKATVFSQAVTETELETAVALGTHLVAIGRTNDGQTHIVVADPGIGMRLIADSGGAIGFHKATHNGSVSWLKAPHHPLDAISVVGNILLGRTSHLEQ